MPAATASGEIVRWNLFQSRDWVDMYAGLVGQQALGGAYEFQSRDWVDMYAGLAP